MSKKQKKAEKEKVLETCREERKAYTWIRNGNGARLINSNPEFCVAMERCLQLSEETLFPNQINQTQAEQRLLQTLSAGQTLTCKSFLRNQLQNKDTNRQKRKVLG